MLYKMVAFLTDAYYETGSENCNNPYQLNGKWVVDIKSAGTFDDLNNAFQKQNYYYWARHNCKDYYYALLEAKQ